MDRPEVESALRDLDRQAARSKRRRPLLSCWVRVPLVLLTLALVLYALFPIFARPGSFLYPRPQRQPTCLSHLKQVGLASLMYAQDYDEVFVRMPGWDDALDPYLKNRELYRCPQDQTNGALSYCMNLDVAGTTLESWSNSSETVAFYDGDGWMVIERHQDGANYAYMDGHAKWLADPPEDSGLFVSEEEPQ